MKLLPFLIHKILFCQRRICLTVALISGCAATSVGFSVAEGSVAPLNHPPTISVKLADHYCVGDYVEIQLKGTDADGDILRYFVESDGDLLPDGLSLNHSTGLISGNLALNPGAGSSTNYEVHVRVRDYPEGAFAETVIKIFVVSTCGAHVSGFSLIDVATSLSLVPLTNGDILDLSLLPTQLSVRTNVSSTQDPIESVVFAFNAKNNFRIENTEPYALSGDINGSFLKVNFLPGPNIITATPYSLNKAKGIAGLSKTINFTVIRSKGNHPPKLYAATKELYCRGDRIEIQVAGNDPDGDKLNYSLDPRSEKLPDNLVLDPKTGLISGLLVRTNNEGTSTNYDILVKATDPRGLSALIRINIFSIDCGLRISDFTLVNASSQKDIRRLTEGETLDLGKLPPRLSIRAGVYPQNIVKSVVFDFNNKKNFQTENQPPYALGGDNNGIYNPVNFLPGINIIKATPFYGISGSGGSDESFIIHVKVIPKSLPLMAKAMALKPGNGFLTNSFKEGEVLIYPNPFTSRLMMQVFSSENKAITTNLYNSAGQLIYTQGMQISKGDQRVEITASQLPAGVYLLHIMNEGRLVGKPLKVIRL